DSLEAIRNNAELIESDRFINELNKLLGPKYFNHSFSVSPQGTDAVLARALAYYIQKRLTEAGRSDSSAWLATSTEEEERKGIFTPPQDMFNRTLEGVAQTMLQEEYFGGDRRGKGIRIVNEFAYKVLSETDPKKIDAIINPLLRQQAQTIADHYFSYVLKAINRENKVRRSEMREAPDLLEVVDEHDQPTGKTIERKQAHQTGERHRAAILFAFNKKGELLMRKRGAQKDIFPDTWTFSASGHVDAGSTYAKTILKEAQEEMGMPLDPQRLNVVGASGMPWSDLKQYAYVFKTQDTEAALEATDRARERLIHESVLPIREDSEGLLWRAWPDSSQGTVTVFLYKLSAQRDTLLDDAKDKVGRILREMVGEYEERVITNRDNRTHYVYRLSEQEEEFLSRRAEDVRRASQTDQAAEVTDLKFFSLDDLRQQFRDHPTLFVDDMLIFFDPQMNRDLEVMEDLSREAKVYEKTSETGLDQNVRELQKRLEEALRDPSADFDAIVFSVNPMFVSVVEETLEGLRGKVFHPKKEIVVLGQDPEGSITDSLSTADRALRKLYGDDYQTQVADKRVAVITMSGFGARMPTDFGKGLLSLPAGRTYLDQVLRQRFFFLDMDFRGLIVFSIDGINIPQYMPKMGKAGIQVIGMPMARTDENVGELGLFVIDEPFRPGAQPIRYAFEKLSRSQRDDYVARQLITKKYVNVSEANYPISWEAFSWLWEQTQSLRKVLDEKYKQEGKTYRDDNLAYNWAEHLFELAFLPDDLIPDYLERLVARSGSIDKDVFEGYLRIAREARQRFGMEFVNVGAESIYYNTNRPDQYRDFLISLISNQVFWEMFNLRNKDGKIVDQKADVSPAVFSKLVDNGVLVSRSIVDFAVQMKKGSLVFNSALAGGTKIETQGAVINSVGKFVVPRGAIVDTVIAPAEGLEVAPDSYTRGYLVRQTDGTVGQVLVSLPVKILASDGRTAELTVTDVKSSLMGKRLSRYKIFPREEHLTNRTPTLVEESPTKYSLDEVRNNIAHNVSWKLRNALAEAISENKKSAFQISETMREMVKNEKALVEKRSEVRGVEEEQVELPLADVGIDAAKAMLDALNAVATQRQEIRLGTGVKSSAAVSVESRLTNLILAIEKQTGKPFPAAFSPDTGAYVTGYNKDRIQNVLAMKEDGLVAEGVVVVIMAASEDDVQAAHNAFGSEIRDRQIEVVRSGANLVAERLSRRYGDSRVQIKPGAVVTEDEAAYLAAAQLANGRVVFVGTNETVVGAYQISVAVMLQSAMEAAQAIATSA
ncbi:MAG TPA: NUDIX domain-containing protein, partial [Candidatus Omnitrophota bacterium]|nr:NUDIX domain-containing protein [Candidatus Omnitrophota bacterium]